VYSIRLMSKVALKKLNLNEILTTQSHTLIRTPEPTELGEVDSMCTLADWLNWASLYMYQLLLIIYPLQVSIVVIYFCTSLFYLTYLKHFLTTNIRKDILNYT
jgi:hypothetical protein